MAELEAVTFIDPTVEQRERNPSAKQGDFGRRFPLIPNMPLTLGRSPETADLAVPMDAMLSASSYHVTVDWDGQRLRVSEKAPPHKNRLREIKDGTPLERIEVPPGSTFWIGQTRFTVLSDDSDGPADPIFEATIAQQARDADGSDLKRVLVADSDAVLSALAEELAEALKTPSGQIQIVHMLEAVVNALPRADAAGLVAVPHGADPDDYKIAVREHFARATGPGINPTGTIVRPRGQFNPSRRLVHRAVRNRESILHYWDPAAAEAMSFSPSLLPVGSADSLPWAICTPLGQKSRSVLYVTGQLRAGESHDRPDVTAEMSGYQKVAALVAALVEVVRQTHRLTKENGFLRPFVPKRVRDCFTDPDRPPAALYRRETDAVVLFCHLRNYTRHLIQQNKPLEERWREVAVHLNMMTTAITNHGGTVCRVLGDAVLGFWGWPDDPNPETDRQAAARAANQIQFGIQWMEKFQCGIGVAVGRALAGQLGTPHLAQIDLYGQVINLAARLEAMTKAFGVRVIVADEVAASLERSTGRSAARFRPLGRVRPKGMEEQPCPVHELLPDDAAEGDDWTKWNEAVAHFNDGRWADAHKLFAKYYPDDAAAKCLMREIDRHGRKPPEGWDGAFDPQPPDGSARPVG